jgi:hypothetical protein
MEFQDNIENNVLEMVFVVVGCSGGAVSRNSFHFFILLFTSLHDSASTGHPQV